MGIIFESQKVWWKVVQKHPFCRKQLHQPLSPFHQPFTSDQIVSELSKDIFRHRKIILRYLSIKEGSKDLYPSTHPSKSETYPSTEESFRKISVRKIRILRIGESFEICCSKDKDLARKIRIFQRESFEFLNLSKSLFESQQ